ncbi:acido-empty-quinoprotein group A [Terriglobus albidus]|uniref:Acido-empty-quinoprotein group A n=1 Tax=Terriglobus albidus TaxID=1592106 RepID=A0A5B9EHJ3_9BACT|nr:acido-empty-quinoprotein group A [Terriglobus albidus]QEE29827.1 acido-empty-quinoprotein group A [Terriglobus albidus]
MKHLFSLAALAVFSLPLSAQTAAVKKPMPSQASQADWPTYNGDYSGRRFSKLSKLNTTNVGKLQLAWTYRITTTTGGGQRISATPLMVDGVMYFTVPSHAWAVDARTGQKLWQFDWASKGGETIGNRGAAIKGDTLYFETEDCNLVAIDIHTGKEKWHSSIGNPDQFYFGSVAPVIVKNHVMVGISGDDFDIPGYVEAHNADTGALEWRWYTHPEPGTPEAKTWPNDEAMTHSGGMTWVAGTYDPDLNLYYFGTGNAQPVINGAARPGDNLFTSTICALNPDTGKLVWYFQPNPHDTHDWDAVQTPVLIDGTVEGKPRKLLAQASRNGWYFLLDRTNGKAITTTPFAKQNWAKGVNDKGQPIPDLAVTAKQNGTLTAPNQAGAANWYPPSFSPLTGLFYVPAYDAYSVYYIYDNNKKPEGWAGNDRGGWSSASLRAMDYRTGKVRWNHEWPTSGARSGILTTAGNLLFTGDPSANLIGFNSTTGEILWHAGLNAPVSNGPTTFELDGLQYITAAAGDTLYAWVLR